MQHLYTFFYRSIIVDVTLYQKSIVCLDAQVKHNIRWNECDSFDESSDRL